MKNVWPAAIWLIFLIEAWRMPLSSTQSEGLLYSVRVPSMTSVALLVV